MAEIGDFVGVIFVPTPFKVPKVSNSTTRHNKLKIVYRNCFCKNSPDILPPLWLFPRGSFAGEKTFRFSAPVRGVTGEFTVSFKDEGTRRVAGGAPGPALIGLARKGDAAPLVSCVVGAEGRRPTLVVAVPFPNFTADSIVPFNFFCKQEI